MKFGNKTTKFLAFFTAVTLCVCLSGCSQDPGSSQSGGLQDSSSQGGSIVQTTVNYANNCNTFVSEDDGYVYVSDTVRIDAVSKKDGTAQQIFADRSGRYMAITAFEAFGGRVYIITMDGMLYSIAQDGSDPQSIQLPAEITVDNNTLANGYTCDGSLYFVFKNSGVQSVWQVGENPLSLTAADADILNKTVAPDGSVFVTETNPTDRTVHLYRQAADGKTEITGAHEAIITNLVNVDENNLFYAANGADTLLMDVYKVSFDGSEKSVLASVPTDRFKYIYYDSENVYIDTYDGVLTFSKETGQQTDAYTPDSAEFEIADGKIIFYMDGFCTDMQTGQVIQF